MGLIRKTGGNQPNPGANDSGPHSFEQVISKESGGSAPQTLSNPNISEFFALCRTGA